MIKYRILKIVKDPNVTSVVHFVNNDENIIECPFQSNFACTPSCAACIEDESQGIIDMEDCTPIYYCMYHLRPKPMFLGIKHDNDRPE